MASGNVVCVLLVRNKKSGNFSIFYLSSMASKLAICMGIRLKNHADALIFQSAI